MLSGPPAETEKDKNSLSNENLNAQEQHVLHQHGKELHIFQLRLVKFCSLSERKEVCRWNWQHLGKINSS